MLIGGSYLLLKAAAYCTWCWLGVRAFRPERAAKLGLGLSLGVLRMLLGLVFGVGIFFAGGAVMESLSRVEALPFGVASALTYLAVYVPVRWLEWGLIEFLLVTGERDLTTVLGGSGKRGVHWRLGGIALSCLADAPWMLAMGGIPLGRFMC